SFPMALGGRTFGSPAVLLLLALPQEARQLGGERLAGGDLALVVDELVDALLELGNVCGRVGVGGDGLADLLAVLLGRLLELLHVDVDVEQLAEAADERERGARARRERDVVRDGRPEADRRNTGFAARVVDDADDSRRAFVARRLETELGDER